ncbi:MAG: hypothetical protein Q9191_003853 [Dirinaria sp. TL-2023a]
MNSSNVQHKEVRAHVISAESPIAAGNGPSEQSASEYGEPVRIEDKVKNFSRLGGSMTKLLGRTISREPEDPGPPPDGGLKAWTQAWMAFALISTYFDKNRALALAVAASGNATGGMVFPAMVETLLPRIGFPWTMRALGFLMLGIAVLNIAIMRTRIPPRKAGPLLEISAFRETTYSLFAVGVFLMFWGQYFGYFYIGSFGRDIIHLKQADSINLVLIMNGIGFFGRLIPGYISDRWCGPFNYVIPCAMITGIILYCWAAVRSHEAMLAWSVLYGWFTAGMQGLFAAMIAGLTTDLKRTGVRMGMIFSVTSIAVLTGPPLGGALIQRDNGCYLNAQMWAATVIVAGGLVLTMARISRTGFKLMVRM